MKIKKNQKRKRKPRNYVETDDLDIDIGESKKRVKGENGIVKNKKGGSYGLNFQCKYCERKFAFKAKWEKHELLHETDPTSKKLQLNEGTERCKYLSIIIKYICL